MVQLFIDEARSSMTGISLPKGGLEGRSLFTNNNRVEFLKEIYKIKTALLKQNGRVYYMFNISILKRNNRLDWSGLKFKH